MARTLTDEDRIATLAALDVNAGNVTRTAEQTGITRLTIRRWRDAALEAGLPVVTDVVTSEKKPKRDWSELYGRAASLGARIITENLRNYRGRDLKPSELRDVAVTVGIAVDKHLDYRDGRKAGAVVDQSQHLTLPPGTTLDELRSLRDGLKQ